VEISLPIRPWIVRFAAITGVLASGCRADVDNERPRDGAAPDGAGDARASSDVVDQDEGANDDFGRVPDATGDATVVVYEGGIDAADGRADGRADADTTNGVDVFGVREIYPTKSGGREWMMNRIDIFADGVYASVVAPTRNADGTWHIVTLRPGEPNQGARMDITAPPGVANWLNIEMTGYVRLTQSSSPQEFAWRTTRRPIGQR
jgi:hypothetical protein